MRKENGITLISLVISIMLMIALSAITVRATLSRNVLQKKDVIEENVNATMQNTDSNIKTEKEKWNGII